MVHASLRACLASGDIHDGTAIAAHASLESFPESAAIALSFPISIAATAVGVKLRVEPWNSTSKRSPPSLASVHAGLCGYAR